MLGKNSDISSLLANFARDKPATVKASPAWDLSVVLKMLLTKPFEPLEEDTLKFLTLKTVFLVAFASGVIEESYMRSCRRCVERTAGQRSLLIRIYSL